MGFRWVALVALWTFLSGPMMAVPNAPSLTKAGRKVVKKTYKGKPDRAKYRR